jgi:ABC-type Na+ efflux pump permease subunit
LAAPLLFLLVHLVAARQMERSWQDQPPSLRRESWIKTFCVPLAKASFARKMRRTLEWNPVAWLQQYSWKARLSKWGLCLVFVVLECAATSTGNADDILNVQSLILLILTSAYTFVGVNSFLAEKKSGALELLLVTPVSPGQIIYGRVWGLWKQFLPAGMTLLLVSVVAQYLISQYPSWGLGRYQDSGITFWNLLTSPLNWGYWSTVPALRFSPYYFESNTFLLSHTSSFRIFVTACGFFTLPVFATCFALRFKNLILAAALTWVALLLCPFSAFCALSFLRTFFYFQPEPASLYVAVFAANFASALLACSYVRRSLSRRIYSF